MEALHASSGEHGRVRGGAYRTLSQLSQRVEQQEALSRRSMSRRRRLRRGSSRLRGSACVDLGVWPLCEVGSRVMLPQQHPPFAPFISLASLTFCMSPPCRAVRFSLVVLPHLATYPFSNHLEVPSFCLTVPCDIRLLPDMRTHLRALRMTPPGAPRCPPWRYDRRTVPRRRGGCIREPRGSSALLLAVSLSTLLSLLIASLPTLPQGC